MSDTLNDQQDVDQTVGINAAMAVLARASALSNESAEDGFGRASVSEINGSLDQVTENLLKFVRNGGNCFTTVRALVTLSEGILKRASDQKVSLGFAVTLSNGGQTTEFKRIFSVRAKVVEYQVTSDQSQYQRGRTYNLNKFAELIADELAKSPEINITMKFEIPKDF